jgi:hypothetical protein
MTLFYVEQLKEAAKRLKGKLDDNSDNGSVLEKLIRLKQIAFSK